MSNQLPNYLGYILSTCILLLVSKSLFSEGMFMDGLLYAGISKNLAEGYGSFWKLYLSDGLDTVFYGHPPLAIWLQSAWFYILGDSIFIEKIYGIFCYAATALFVVKIWNKISGVPKYAVLPLLLWLSVVNVQWAVTNNLLENTMMVFVVFSAYMYLKYTEKKYSFYLVFSGVSLSLAMLTKGFTGLYIWSFPFWFSIIYRKQLDWKCLRESIVLVGVSLLPFLILYSSHEGAREYIVGYFNSQIVGSLQASKTVGNRFAIIGMMMQNIVVPSMIVVFIVFWAKRFSKKYIITRQNLTLFFLFFCISLSGVLPIMISLKQRDFYILTIYPFMGIALGILALDSLKYIVSKYRLPFYLKFSKILFKISIVVTLMLAISAHYHYGRIGREKEIISDCKKVIKELGTHKSIGLCPELFSNWYLHGYFVRYGGISLVKDSYNDFDYFLGLSSCIEPSFEKIEIQTKKYHLYRKIQQ